MTEFVGKLKTKTINTENETNLFTEFENEILNGQIPIEFICNESAIASTILPRSYFGLYSRYSFVPLVSYDAVEYLKPNTIDIANQIWFSSNNIPLKPNLPLGVLYDLTNSSSVLPWKITINFQGYPTELLIKCKTRENIESFYYQSLKQSLYLLYNSTNIFNSLSSNLQKQLWDGIVTNEIYSSKVILNQLITNIQTFRTIPIRILLLNTLIIIQKPINIQNSVTITLINVISLILNISIDILLQNNISVTIHGIKMSLDASILSIWQYFHHFDLFLYLIIDIPSNLLTINE